MNAVILAAGLGSRFGDITKKHIRLFYLLVEYLILKEQFNICQNSVLLK